MRVYFAYNSKYIEQARQAVEYMRERCPDIKIFFPDVQKDGDIRKDIIGVKNSDILVLFMPEPSVGATCELVYFRLLSDFVSKPVVGYKCMDHIWLDSMLDHRTDDLDTVIEILNEYRTVLER